MMVGWSPGGGLRHADQRTMTAGRTDHVRITARHDLSQYSAVSEGAGLKRVVIKQWRKGMKMTLRTMAMATATFACAALFSPGWSEQGGLSLSVGKAEAYTRVYIHTGYAASAHYYTHEGVPWNAVRAYYFNGPWTGPGYSYAGWDDYAARYGIACRPGTAVKGGDGILYNCQ
jgi:hypothetical protein